MRRVQLRRVAGWRLPTGVVKVARPTRWGNPFTVEEHGREQAVELYRRRLFELPAGDLAALLEPLRGAAGLACWCAPGELCHADVLIELLREAV